VALTVGLSAHAQYATSTIPMGFNPLGGIAVNPVTNKIYVANSAYFNEPEGALPGGSSVTIIDGVTNATTVVPTGVAPGAIAVNPVTNKVYVANTGENTVTVIDGVTDATSTVDIGVPPTFVAVNPVTDKIYVCTSNGAYVSVIDGSSNAVTKVNVGFFTGALAVNTITNKIYVALVFADHNVTMIDGATNATSVVLDGYFAGPILVNPVTNKVYVVFPSNVTVLDGSTNEATVVETAGSFPNAGGELNPVTNRLYIPAPSGNYVTVIDGATNATTTVPTGSSPENHAVNPVTNSIYVANSASNNVTVINGVTNATTTVPVGSTPGAIAVNPVTNNVYVENTAGNSVTVIAGTTPGSPSFSTQPLSQVVNIGAPVALDAIVSGTASQNYLWFDNGVALSDGNGIYGTSTPVLYLSEGATPAETGVYSCVATNSAGSQSSRTVALDVIGTSTPGRIVNLSSRRFVGTGANVMIAGFVVNGSGSKALVLRGIGPALADFGVPGLLIDPILSLYDSASPANLITGDTGWQNVPLAPSASWAAEVTPLDATAANFAQVGAFELAPHSTDSAIVISLPVGNYTSQVSGAHTLQLDNPTQETGVALAEVYDADPGDPSAQLVNISTRAFVGSGSNILIAGFAIEGSTSKTVLIRASGPALATFGVPATLPDPLVQVLDSDQKLIASDFGWGGQPQIANAAASAGAFRWSEASSNDSAILITLPPGSYTAEASGQSGDTGVALIEVYAVPAASH
jgi:YVTN family beta-propeller protein